MAVGWMLLEVIENREHITHTLGELIGMQYVNVSELKHRRVPERINTNVLKRICRALDCGVEKLLVITNPLPPPHIRDLSRRLKAK